MGMYSMLLKFDVKIPKEEVERFRAALERARELYEAQNSQLTPESLKKKVEEMLNGQYLGWIHYVGDVVVTDDGEVHLYEVERKWFGYSIEGFYNLLAQFKATGTIVYDYLEMEWPDKGVVLFKDGKWTECLWGLKNEELEKELMSEGEEIESGPYPYRIVLVQGSTEGRGQLTVLESEDYWGEKSVREEKSGKAFEARHLLSQFKELYEEGLKEFNEKEEGIEMM